MSSVLNPYLAFRGTARQALEFYQSVFGGELTLGTFGEMMPRDDVDNDQIMHGQLQTNAGYTIMGSDTPSSMPYSETSNISISLSGDDTDALRGYFAGLSDGGNVLEPLTAAPWGDEFGMVTDRFGVTWLMNISGGAA